MWSQVQRLSSAGAVTGQIHTLRPRIGFAHSGFKDAPTVRRAGRTAPVTVLARLKQAVAHFGGLQGAVTVRASCWPGAFSAIRGCTNWRASQRSSRLTSSTPKTSVALLLGESSLVACVIRPFLK